MASDPPRMLDSDFANWASNLRIRAALPPLRPRFALTAAGAPGCFGSIEPDLALHMASAGLPLLQRGDAWQVLEPLDESLARMAAWLDGHGLAGRRRGELLAVNNEHGQRLSAIERGAVRPLGIKTCAVHLVCSRDAGGVWVQQRALNKATDPGLWDTTMGGQVGDGESSAETLERETWEEAGLRLSQLQELAFVERIEIRRPVAEGYLLEGIDVYRASLAHTLQPLNQDGEVQCFECLALPALKHRLRRGAFTLEAALILSAWLERFGAL